MRPESIQEVELTLMAAGNLGLDPILEGFCRIPPGRLRRKLVDLTVRVDYFMPIGWVSCGLLAAEVAMRSVRTGC